MIDLNQLSAADLSALLSSRICHDIISPVGAINNGLELLDEEGAEEAAMDLVRSSAVTAAARLQFLRIAFGAAGSAGVEIDTGDAETVAKAWMAGEKPEFTWQCERAYLPKNQVKLLLNMLVIANASIPRGGDVLCQLENTADKRPTITVTATGRMQRVPQKLQDMLDGRVGEEPIDAHTVQFYYTLLLADLAGMDFHATGGDDPVVYKATPRAA